MAPAFSATQSYIGVPDFKIIDIDTNEVAKALQVYLERGSKLVGVSLDDIDRSVTAIPSNAESTNLAGLLGIGMKLFDAIVWLSAGRPNSHPLVVNPNLKQGSLPSMAEIARAVFYVYFFLLTQARYPARQGVADPPKVSRFLYQIMGMTEPQHVYLEMICGFEASKFDPAWAKAVRFNNFGQETLSRFGLGVAGYRSFGPFKLYTPKDDTPENLKSAIRFAEKIAKSPPTWDVHPLTRNPTILTNRGNLNKNLGNLILDVFTDEQIKEMVSAKVLFSKPTREPNHRNYLSWAEKDDISGSTHIFRQ